MKKHIAIVLALVLVVLMALTMVGCGKSYTITFKNGDTVVATVEVKDGEKITAPAAPSKDGYTFTGWFADGKKLTDDTVATGDATYTAKFDQNLAHVVFKNGETEVMSIDYIPGSTITEQPAENPTKDPEGTTTFVFDGWVDAAGNKLVVGTTTADADVVFTPSFTEIHTVVITFMNGETVHRVIDTLQVGENLPQIKIPTQEGKTFKGWFNAQGVELVARSEVTGDATWYAAYECTGDHLFICDPVTVGDKTVVPCYNCDCVKPADGDAVFLYGVTKTLPDTTWTLTFRKDGAVVDTKTVQNGHTLAEMPTDPAKDGLNFLGWFLDGEKLTESTVILSDMTLDAAFVCPGEHAYTMAPVYTGEYIYIHCANCDSAQIFSTKFAYTMDDDAPLPLGPGGASTWKIFNDTDGDVISQTIVEADGNKYTRLAASGVRPETTQIQNQRNNTLLLGKDTGIISIKMRVSEVATEGDATAEPPTTLNQDLQFIMTNVGTWEAVADGDGISANNSTNGCAAFWLKGNKLYRGSGAELIATISSDDFVQIDVVYSLDAANKTMTFDYFIDGEHVHTWVRTNVQLAKVNGLYFNGNLKAENTSMDIDDLIGTIYTGELPVFTFVE